MDPNGPRTPITPERLDLLVDGTLPEADRRALLLALEAEPDGWRRCALAFLEAQAWRGGIGSMASPAPPRLAPDEAAILHRPRSRLVPIALAAGIALSAFLLGRLTVPAMRPNPAPRPDVLVADRPDPRPLAGDPSVADLQVPRESRTNPPEAPRFQAVGILNLASEDDPDAPLVQLPVLSGPGLDDRWLRGQPSFVPEEVRRSWERRGLDVELQRRLVSVQLDDSGRYLTIPVDEVRLREPARTTY
jgi:hypothetical protein